MPKNTDELLKSLRRSPSVTDYFAVENESLISMTLSECLSQYISKKSLDKSMVVHRSGLQRNYAYQIFSGERKNPSRNKILALCFGMGLDFEETQRLLKCTGYPILYPKNERDSVIIFCLMKTISLTDVNELLFDLNLELIE